MTNASRMAALFFSDAPAHGTHGEPVWNGRKWDINTTARTVREPVTAKLWEKHLRGERPLGVVAISRDSNCRWGSIDVDQYDADVLDIVRRLEAARLSLVPVRSKSGGLHLFLFLAEPQPAQQVIDRLRSWAERLGLEGVEIFPKQVALDAMRGDAGNWIIMPYFGSTFDGKLKEQVGLKKTGAAMELVEFIDTAERLRVSSLRKTIDEFSDGPPCLQERAARGVSEGNRNNTLFNFAVYARKKYGERWQAKVDEYNVRFCRPPLGADEVIQIRRSVSRRDYDYSFKCDQLDCDRGRCCGRPLGRGSGGIVFEKVVITEGGEEVTWNITIHGKVVTVTVAELADQRGFLKRVLAVTRRLHAPMKSAAWAALVTAAGETAEVREAPPETTELEQFRLELEEFLTNRGRGDRREDLVLGRPWEDQDNARHLFSLSELRKFLKREGVFQGKTANWAADRIRELGGDRTSITVRGKSLGVFQVPSGVIHVASEEPGPRIVRAAPI